MAQLHPRASVLLLLALAMVHCSGGGDVPSDTTAGAPSSGASGAGTGGAGTGGAGTGGTGTGGAGTGGAGFEVTGSADFGELTAIFAARCIGCHNGSSASLVDLRDDPGLYGRLTTPLATSSCNGRTLVVPGSVDDSLLPAKVQPRPPCGNRMPSECAREGCLSAAEIQTIVNYVGSGAAGP